MPEDYFDLPALDDTEKPGTRDYDIVKWCDERLHRGIKFIESQVGYDRIDDAINTIFSNEKQTKASYAPQGGKLSKTQANLTAKIAEDLTAMLTDVRYFWNYTTQNQKYENQCRLSNKGGENWYNRHNVDLRIGDVIRYYTVAGTGIGHLYYSRRFDDFILEAEDPRCVYPIDPMDYHTFQTCAGAITRRARTPEWVREEFGKVVRPDTGGGIGNTVASWLKQMISGPGERSGGPLTKRSGADQPIPETPTVFVNNMYLFDKRVNKTGKDVYMGKWDANYTQAQNPWSYKVPAGAPLYPFNRLIIWCSGTKLYDGPAPYWHCKIPLIKFTLNPWPKSWFGKAPLWDVLPLQASLNSNLRVIDDHCAQVAQPGVVGDRNVSKAEMAKVNTRAAGMKVRTNTASGKGIQVVNPPPLDNVIWEVVKWCVEMMGKLAGTADPSAMASLNQIPSDDTIDTIMKAMTPGVRLRSRILEGAYKELAEQFLYNFWEWDSMTRRIAMFGPQGAVAEDFDFSPGVGIPDDVPDGDPGDIANMEGSLLTGNPRPMYNRARYMLMSFACKFDPSSLLNSAAQQELMKYFLLAKMGYISCFTLMEKMGIMNFAPPSLVIPPDEIGRLALQQRLGIGMIANAQGRKATDGAPPSMGETANGPTIQTS